jgi:hypothetical protein
MATYLNVYVADGIAVKVKFVQALLVFKTQSWN